MGHAVLDLPSRQWKAIKIERLLDLDARPGALRLLEVGTGSGGIAHYFGTHPSGRFEVDAVDVEDSRLVREGFRYTPVTDTRLPFADESFDIVLSNHVIEHVGDQAEQVKHLSELRRVLKSDGIGYLAVPNRWMLVEPHFRLAFLSWLPVPLRSPYLRLARRGRVYDCRPLMVGQIESLLSEAGFDFVQEHGRALRLTYEIERPRALTYRLIWSRLPDALYRGLRRVFPTLIYRLTKSRRIGAAR
jgi:SAM-dependent methyltransferase